MPFEDVRQFMEALDRTGDLVRVKDEVDWEFEAAAIARRACERRGPAILFEKIKDYPEGYRIFSGSLGTHRRVAIALGLHPDTPVADIYAEYARGVQQPIKPIVVDWGHCKENIMRGGDVDLHCFPAPLIHEGDGGRYLGTWDIVVNNDPDSDWMNWGMYRFLIHNKRSLVGYPHPNSHFGMIFSEKYLPCSRPMPMAIVLGADPLCHLVATAAYRKGESEVDFAGGLRQKPAKLVKCETSELLVPADAEIVIEGEALPDATAPEGPFGEYVGYRIPEQRSGVICEVKAITYRTSPIVSMVSVGVPVDESTVAEGVTAALRLKRRLERENIPVTEVYAPPEGATHLLIVGVKSGGIDVAKRIRDVITARRMTISKLIVVDEDVDVFDMVQVLHAFATKCHPVRGIDVIEDEGRGNPSTPAFSVEERKRRYGASVLFDCTWPVNWSKETEVPMKSSFDVIYPKQVRSKVVRNWEKYGFR